MQIRFFHIHSFIHWEVPDFIRSFIDSLIHFLCFRLYFWLFLASFSIHLFQISDLFELFHCHKQLFTRQKRNTHKNITKGQAVFKACLRYKKLNLFAANPNAIQVHIWYNLLWLSLRRSYKSTNCPLPICLLLQKTNCQ